MDKQKHFQEQKVYSEMWIEHIKIFMDIPIFTPNKGSVNPNMVWVQVTNMTIHSLKPLVEYIENTFGKSSVVTLGVPFGEKYMTLSCSKDELDKYIFNRKESLEKGLITV